MSIFEPKITLENEPTQFNERNDFNDYPIDIENDSLLLKEAGCSIVFIPAATEIYPDSETIQTFSFPKIESVMEGEHRPGHFTGVAQVVKRFFDIITPDYAFFGLKDYQQYLVIKTLVKEENIATRVVGCSTIRETDGLAMSSRNRLLTKEQREVATTIYDILNDVKKDITTRDFATLKREAIEKLTKKGFSPEYFEIATASTLSAVTKFKENTSIRAFIAAKIGNVRLIDNMELT